jgi:serine protease Do
MKPSPILAITDRSLLLIVAVILLLSGHSAGGDAEVTKSPDRVFVEAVQKVLPAVVSVSAVASKEKTDDQDSRDAGLGAGTIIDPAGLILTSAHVVKDIGLIKVTLSDRRTFRAHIQGFYVESDLAVIKIHADGLPAAQWGDSSTLEVGQMVLTIGSPFGLSRTVTSGIVSAVGRTNVGIIDYEEFIQTDAPINPGSSGGPLLDIQGCVVGITTAMASRGGGYQGVGFAVPSNSARVIVEALISEGRVKRGALGLNIQDLDEALAKSFGRSSTEGALVAEVKQGGPAEKAGIKEGDIILQFDGAGFYGANQLKNLIARRKPGETDLLKIYRQPETFDLNIELVERATKTAPVSVETQAMEKPATLGLVLEAIGGYTARKMGLLPGQGLYVKKVGEKGLGTMIGIKAGDVILEINERPARDIAEFKAAVSEAEKDRPVRFKIKRGESKIFAAYVPR